MAGQTGSVLDPATAKNLTEFFLARLAVAPQAPAISYPVIDPQNPDAPPTWKTLTWEDYGNRVRCIAAGLLSLGFKKGHRLALYAPTTLAWVLMDTAVICIGGVSVPIYETTVAKDVQKHLQDSEAPFLFVQHQRGWEMALEFLHSLPNLQRIITAEKVLGDSEVQIDLHDLEARGRQGLERANMLGPKAVEGDLLKHAAANVEPERQACLYHTSGTLGVPQPVAISQRMLLAQIRQLKLAFAEQFSSQETALSMLPYSHIFGRIEWLCHLAFGGHGYLAEGFARIPEYLKQVHPTILFTVPRVLEKIRQRIYQQIAELSGLRRVIAEKSLAMAQADETSGLKGILADKLVFGKIHEALGGKFHTIVVAGAPLSIEISRFFGAIGIKLLEAYGLTETTGALCVTTGDEAQFGTVGKPLAETQVKLAFDGEIFIQAPTVFPGYGTNIDEGKREEIFIDQWFRTGDVGEWDEKGNLRITGRKKDIIVTAAGKNIAPQRLENFFAQEPVFDQVLVLGENKPFLVAFLVLNRDLLAAVLDNPQIATHDFWFQDTAVKDWVAARVEQINANLAPFETIKKFAILPQPLSVDKKELTLSQKPRRQAIHMKYKDLFEALYQDEASAAAPEIPPFSSSQGFGK